MSRTLTHLDTDEVLVELEESLLADHLPRTGHHFENELQNTWVGVCFNDTSLPVPRDPRLFLMEREGGMDGG